MSKELETRYNTDKNTWNNCASIYEDEIVSGHPDVVAYERFEEIFLDSILSLLAPRTEKAIKLIDLGCGSGRLHIRYGKYVKIPSLEIVHGIDFSPEMLKIARTKLQDENISDSFYPLLQFEQGSAFDLQPEIDTYLPIVVNLINSIGVMQGSEGAQKLFQSVRNCVENAGGIGIISCYRKEYVEEYALPQYESTLNVGGQPVWLKPDTYSAQKYTLKPKYYKRAKSDDQSLEVEVFENGKLIKSNFLLFRDKQLTNKTIENGNIRTFSDYESNWYSFSQIDEWIQKYWNGLPAYHIPTNQLDPKNAEAGQLAILDANNNLKEFVKDVS